MYVDTIYTVLWLLHYNVLIHTVCFCTIFSCMCTYLNLDCFKCIYVYVYVIVILHILNGPLIYIYSAFSDLLCNSVDAGLVSSSVVNWCLDWHLINWSDYFENWTKT